MKNSNNFGLMLWLCLFLVSNTAIGQKAYLFNGSNYIRFDIAQDKVDQGEKPILGNWKDVPSNWVNFDACVNWGNGKIYMFKGDKYIRFDIAQDKVDQGEKPIKGNWNGFPAQWSSIDACVNWGNGKVYIFKGDKYIRFDIAQDKVDQGEKPIKGNWSGFPAHWSSMDACINWGNGKVYMFRGDKYIRFDIAQDKVDQGEKPIKGNWNGFPAHWNGISDIVIIKNEPQVPVVPTTTPLKGFVDMHTHPMSHLAWGGKLVHGAPDAGILMPAIPSGRGCRQYERAANIGEALPTCNATHGGFGLFDNTCGDDIRKKLLRLTESKLGNGSVQSKHHEDGAQGYPNFKFWPAHNDMTHQQMWIDWIKRTYNNGLRVMVALAVNNVTYAAGFSGHGDRNPDDVSSANVQIEELKRLVDRHNGSTGSLDNWMEIAFSAADVRRIVNSNKLAIVLGMETDNIGNFHQNANVNANSLTDVGKQTVINEIQRLFDQGVRYIFPIHLVNNKFGGTAVYESNFNFSNYHQTGQFFDVICANPSDGITKPFAQFEWTLGLIGAKIGVDIARRPPNAPACVPPTIGHKNRLSLTPMGEFAIQEMMKRGMLIDIDHMSNEATNATLILAERYNYPVNSGHNGVRGGAEASERSLTVGQYQRIAKLDGIIGMGTDGATAESFRTGFAQLQSVMSSKGVAIGTDANGFAKLPVPPRGNRITYNASFPICQTGNRRWDYNTEGVAHYGLMADFLKDVQSAGTIGEQIINHLNRSAEFFAQMWEKCERQKANVR
jgi:microsomal dipeptidase-like Zn-dependent dipeptidase